jgi:hypothetical protein
MAPHTPARRLAGREMEMKSQLIASVILALFAGFNAAAQDSDDKSLAAAEAAYAKSALVFQQMRETRK